MRTLILGGARSGRSRRALQLARQHAPDIVFIAADVARDDDVRLRVARHDERRPCAWTTLDHGTALGAAVAAAADCGCIVVDGLTQWLAHLVCSATPETLDREVDALLDAVDDLPADLVLLANETGEGVVPDEALARRFGEVEVALHRRLAQRCERVEWTVSGLAVVLKPSATPGTLQ